MLRIRFLVKGFSHSYSRFSTQHITEKAMMDIKFASAKNLDSFLNDIDLSKTSHSMLSYAFKISNKQTQKFSIAALNKLLQIKIEVFSNLEKLDPQGIVNFCEGFGNSNILDDTGALLAQEKKKMLIDRINEYVISRSFDQKQILLIFEILAPRGWRIKEIDNEIEKIVDSKLNLEEISKILTGCGGNSWKKDWILSCMEKLCQLHKKELDGKHLAKILDALPIKDLWGMRHHILNFLKVIEDTLWKWKENDLLSIMKFFKASHFSYPSLYYIALKRLNGLLCYNQSIEFVIELASLLKKNEWKNDITDEILSKSSEIVKEKLLKETIDIENLKRILDFMKPNIDYQTALTLADQINSKNIFPDEFMRIFQNASWLSVNKEGKLFNFADLISENINYNKIQGLTYRYKIDTLISIIQTKNYELYGLQKIKELLAYDLNEWITLKDDNYKHLIHTIRDKEYSSNLLKELKPLQATIFRLLKRRPMKANNLYCSIQFYESDPERWKDFVIENKSDFSFEDILKTIRFYKGPFEAIIFLLMTYKNILSVQWIGAAMDNIFEVKNVQILNDFARILNKIDPHYLLNEIAIYPRIEVFNYLFQNSDYSLLEDLFVGAYNLLKDLPIHAVFSFKNIKILYFASQK